MAGGENVLVRGVNWLGDAVMTTPALLRLREARLDAHVTLITPAKLADLWRHHPAIDAVIAVEAGENPWRVARRLRGQGFQIGLVLPNSPRSALELWLARIPERIGYARAWRRWWLTRTVPLPPDDAPMRKRSISEIKGLLRESAFPAPATATAIAIAPGTHHLYYYLHLTSALGAKVEPIAPLLYVSPEEIQAIRARLDPEAASPSRQSWCALNAAAEYGSAKRWPSERFIAAAIEIQRQTDCRWLVLGGPNDLDLAAQITSGIQRGGPERSLQHASSPKDGVINLAGRTTLRDLCAVLKACRVLLTNDTGPMHVAAALGTPVVALFGSTSPELTGPGLPGDPVHRLLQNKVPCAPCFRRICPVDFRCMNGISVEQVVAAVIRSMDQNSRPPDTQ